MSEAERILGQFRTTRHFERAASGLEPVVCIAGHISYLALENALRLVYADILVTDKWQGWITFENVHVYASKSFEDGFYFGHIEPQP